MEAAEDSDENEVKDVDMAMVEIVQELLYQICLF